MPWRRSIRLGIMILSCWTSGLRFRRCRRCPAHSSSVEALKTHPDFDLRNPNRIRALVSSFAGNQVRFHDASGMGYRLYADTIIQLDPTNGQVAARMVSPLGQWRRFDAGRQDLMKRQLQRILDLPGLSRNTFEMASKSIA